VSQIPAQLVLPFACTQIPSFANFVVGENSEAVSALRRQAISVQGSIFLYGHTGRGISHLCQATVHLAQEMEHSALYLDLSQARLCPEVLDNIDQFELVVLDEIRSVTSGFAWQEALFHLYNRIHDRGHSLLIGCDRLPLELALELVDLTSRLNAIPPYRIQGLNDAQKRQAIAARLAQRGLKLPDEVGHFLLTRGPRDIRQLMEAVEQLDFASLVEKRPLTVPLVKKTLGL